MRANLAIEAFLVMAAATGLNCAHMMRPPKLPAPITHDLKCDMQADEPIVRQVLIRSLAAEGWILMDGGPNIISMRQDWKDRDAMFAHALATPGMTVSLPQKRLYITLFPVGNGRTRVLSKVYGQVYGQPQMDISRERGHDVWGIMHAARVSIVEQLSELASAERH